MTTRHDSRRSGRTINRVVLAAAIGVTAAAVAKELRRPAEERTWRGRIVGLPYDFRPPTLARIRAEYWAPDNDALFTPHAFGVGYGVNLARLVRPLPPGK
ncbi:DUF5808 domain-containing protein [Streptacidiphilus neutrinimicus]|uniref:DUF5808 domain-containing protein n=1 Tax=Streptacidiphilus neutrinimicus TaxID=105420 RepID=UPI0005A6165C|nr:DUF5808 domain-containing protein [Streptacidiphilus neutrinimicus]